MQATPWLGCGLCEGPSPVFRQTKDKAGPKQLASCPAPRARSARPAVGDRGSSVTATKRTVQGEGQKGGTGNGAHGQGPSVETPGTRRPGLGRPAGGTAYLGSGS